jgi:hypothetical protein
METTGENKYGRAAVGRQNIYIYPWSFLKEEKKTLRFIWES